MRAACRRSVAFLPACPTSSSSGLSPVQEPLSSSGCPCLATRPAPRPAPNRRAAALPEESATRMLAPVESKQICEQCRGRTATRCDAYRYELTRSLQRHSSRENQNTRKSRRQPRFQSESPAIELEPGVWSAVDESYQV